MSKEYSEIEMVGFRNMSPAELFHRFRDDDHPIVKLLIGNFEDLEVEAESAEIDDLNTRIAELEAEVEGLKKHGKEQDSKITELKKQLEFSAKQLRAFSDTIEREADKVRVAA